MNRLAAVFADGGGVAAVSALTGSRGAGKTQVAAQYARAAVAEGIELVAWVSAEDHSRVLAGLAEVARRVGVADPEGDSETSAERLRDALVVRRTTSVLVLDNATDPDTIRRYLPATGMTRTIITSTDHAFASLGVDITVDTFDRAQSVAYLRERTGLHDDVGADRLAGELGDLPLALAQAATVITLQGQTYDVYLDRLRALPMDATLPAARGDGYPHGVARAVTLSVLAVEDTGASGMTRNVIATAALLDSSGVSRSLLSQLAGAPSEQELDETLAHLVEASLMVWGEDRQAIVMHRLIARAIRDQLQATGELQDRITVGRYRLQQLLPEKDHAWEHREDGTELVAQAIALWENAVDASDRGAMTTEGVEMAANLAIWAVRHLTATADFSRAIDTGTAVLASCEKTLGLDHPVTLVSGDNLANAYQSAGQLDRAIGLHEATLATRERVFGSDHPDTLVSDNNLANAYQSAGQLDKAIGLHEATLATHERVFGPDHPETLICRNNLASAYQFAGQFDRAIGLHEATLATRERVFGSDHPDTLVSDNNLANAYQSARQLDKAIGLHEATLATHERVFGSDHPNTLTSSNNLASAYQFAGQLDRAIGLHEATLATRERVFGSDHPNTLTSRNNLANAYLFAGQLDKAIGLHEATLTTCECALGSDHPNTLASRNNLAFTYLSAGQLDKAIPLYEYNLTTCERVLGSDHPNTLTSGDNLASAYQAAGQFEEAISLHKDTFAARERVLGLDHPDTVISRDNLAKAQRAIEKSV